MNPLDSHPYQVKSEGNLKNTVSNIGWHTGRSTFYVDSGKHYWEAVVSGGNIANFMGVDSYSHVVTGAAQAVGFLAPSWSFYNNNGNTYDSGTATNLTTASSIGDIIMIALDLDNGKIWFGRNGTWLGSSSDPAAGTGARYTNLSGYSMSPAFSLYHVGSTTIANFGQDSSFAGTKTPQGHSDSGGIGDFYYAPPTGFLALCTKNLPDVAVVPSENFNTIIWSGAGNASRNFTGVGFQPDFVWARNRTGVANNLLYDSIRTAGANKNLISNTTDVEGGSNPDSYDYLSSFNTDGFSSTWSGSNSAYYFNQSSYNYVAWNWKAGGSASSNTNGTITSSVSANVDAGFSILTYTGTGVLAATIGHGLAQKPELIIRKDRDTAVNWVVNSTVLGTGNMNQGLFLNTGVAIDTAQGWMNNTAPTSTVFTQGNQGFVGVNGRNYIAYCFHSVDGYSKVGSYVGNGNADGPFVYCGFRPKWILWKNSSAAGNDWDMYDTARDPHNVAYKELLANGTGAESSSTTLSLDINSNGFKLRTSNANGNGNGNTFVFLAFAETPFKHSNAR
jgi:hypothetical protein